VMMNFLRERLLIGLDLLVDFEMMSELCD
jgi:hypothetical protein